MTGKVLWWSEKWQKGVVYDSLNNEYYIDSSVLDASFKNKLSKEEVVNFEPLRNNGILCAKSVKSVPAKKKKSVLAKFELELVQCSFSLDMEKSSVA